MTQSSGGSCVDRFEIIVANIRKSFGEYSHALLRGTGSINPKFDLFQRFDSQSEKHCYHNEARTSRGNLIYMNLRQTLQAPILVFALTVATLLISQYISNTMDRPCDCEEQTGDFTYGVEHF